MSVAPIRQLKRKSGGNIAYYDGATLLGKKSVPAGQDVLHPSIVMPSKTGYTFVGWSTSASEADWTDTLVSTGEPMNLYAVYAANSLTVVSGSIIQAQNGPAYSGSVFNTAYVSGNASAYVELWYQEGGKGDTKTLTLNKKYYQTADATVGWDARAYGNGSFDNVQIGSGDEPAYRSFSNLANGNHTIVASVYSSQTTTWYISATGVTALTLSNPTAWT